MKNKDLYKKAVDKFGVKIQIDLFCEECSELLSAIFKSRRCGKIQDNFYEEIADVKIMLEQLFFILGIDPDDPENYKEVGYLPAVFRDNVNVTKFIDEQIFHIAIAILIRLINYIHDFISLDKYMFNDVGVRWQWEKLWYITEHYYIKHDEVRDYYKQKIERLKIRTENKEGE